MRTPKLVTKKLENVFSKYPLSSQDGKGCKAVAIAKFFAPIGDFTLYVLEAQKEEDGDFTFYGLVHNKGCIEYGYFTLSEMTNVRLPFGLHIERDIYFQQTNVEDISQYGIGDYVKNLYS